MDEAGLIALPLRVNGLEVKVSPVSPLAMAQNLDEINNIMQFMQITQAMGPEGQLAINVDSTIDYVADKLGVPAAVRRTPEERQQLKDQMTQVATQAAQQQAAQQEGQMA
jgi:hypothetical protein